jgi:hypothetical protein
MKLDGHQNTAFPEMGCPFHASCTLTQYVISQRVFHYGPPLSPIFMTRSHASKMQGSRVIIAHTILKDTAATAHSHRPTGESRLTGVR